MAEPPRGRHGATANADSALFFVLREAGMAGSRRWTLDVDRGTIPPVIGE